MKNTQLCLADKRYLKCMSKGNSTSLRQVRWMKNTFNGGGWVAPVEDKKVYIDFIDSGAKGGITQDIGAGSGDAPTPGYAPAGPGI